MKNESWMGDFQFEIVTNSVCSVNDDSFSKFFMMQRLSLSVKIIARYERRDTFLMKVRFSRSKTESSSSRRLNSFIMNLSSHKIISYWYIWLKLCIWSFKLTIKKDCLLKICWLQYRIHWYIKSGFYRSTRSFFPIWNKILYKRHFFQQVEFYNIIKKWKY
jgi:hypothetical protein